MTAVELAATLRRVSAEELLLPVLVQLAVIIAAARVFGTLARRVGQPAVVGEVVAGLVLGPSLVGWLAPGLFAAVFRPPLPGVPDELAAAALPLVFQTLAELGLILLLFLIGLEVEFAHLRGSGRAAAGIAVAGTALPFALGAALGPVLHPHLEPHPTAGPVPLVGLTLFLGVALAITAIPVLGRMMHELGVSRTKLGAVVIAAAAVGDAVGWVLLAAVAALAESAFDPWQTARMVGLTVGFVLGMVYLVRPALTRYLNWSLRAADGALTLNALGVVLAALLLTALATNRIGVFAVFGAFVLGAVLSDQPAVRRAVTARVQDFVTAFFLPVFFTYTGLRTEVGGAGGATMWLLCGALLVAAVVGKVGGCGVAAWMAGFPPREAAVAGVLMNTRGLIVLVVINLGYDLGVIPKSVFGMLVLMAVVTTVMTTPLVLWLRHGTELDGPIRASGFLGRREPVAVE